MTAEERLDKMTTAYAAGNYNLAATQARDIATKAVSLLREFQRLTVLGHWEDCDYHRKRFPCTCGWHDLLIRRDAFLDGEKP